MGAFEVHGFAGPQLAEQRERLIHAAAARPRLDAEHLELFDPPADARAEDHPPAGQVVERGDHLGMEHRLAHRQHQHAGRELDALSDRREVREQRQRLEEVVRGRHGERAVRRVRVAGGAVLVEHDVIDHPERIVARGLGGAGDLDGALRGCVGSDLGDAEADLHRSLLDVPAVGSGAGC